MQDEYGLTLKEGEADMYKHSTNRDVRYAERELHFVIPSTVQGITHLAIFFSSSMQKDANRPLEGANKQVISSQADSLIKISRIWADFFPANTSNQPI
ncbi:hypothetical protein SM35_05154 [Klebsiella pneumoniae]|nr:hypothetical protein SM35_05154 [Klebsiella pneumoniae]VUK83452.1 Uncharacterised protein [Klebsiella pneumoniae]